MVVTLVSRVKFNLPFRSVVTLFALLTVLSVHCMASASASGPQAKPQVVPVSILDEVGQLNGLYSASNVASWKSKAVGSGEDAEVARLNLGEYELAHDQEPENALVTFSQIQKSADPKSSLYGTASYDSAVALYYEGAYRQSLRAFSDLLKNRPVGIDPRRCALWLRHADACAGYHAENAALGIPEPPRLDPFCGAAGLAEVLRSMGLNSSRKYIVAHCRVTGEGSTLADVANAARSMGLSAYTLTTDDNGLIALRHPMVAYVENDHFVAMVGANKTGVTYLCSDCGPWPGGQAHVTWKQWHAMLPSEFLAVAQAGTDWDTTLKETLAQSGPTPVRLSYVGDLASLGENNELQLRALISILRGHVFLGNNNGGVTCGNKPQGLECTPFIYCCKDCQKKMHRAGSSTAGDPVNLATGEEEYSPDPDLVVYNPVGPSIYWDRIYNSLRGPSTTYQCDDYGVGWSTSYNLAVLDNGFGGAGTKYIVFANGSRAQFSASAVPSASTPIVLCTPQTSGIPLEMEWTYDSTTTKSFYRIRSLSGAAWDTSETNIATVGGNSYYCPIGKKYDVAGNAITFNYQSTFGPSGLPLLSSITNSRGTALLTINRSGSYSNISSVSDSNGRSVYYTTATYNNSGVNPPYPVSYQELNQVSQVVATGTGSPAYRWKYGYGLVPIPDGIEQVNFLTSIGVPSPTGSGAMVQATIAYAANNCNVTSLTDANGNKTTYTSVASNGTPLFPSTYTKVSIANSAGAVSYSYVSGYSTNMSQTSTTDGKGNITETVVYSSATDPYMPSSVTNANGNKWNYNWDSYGNLLTVVTPRNVTDTFTITHPSATYPIISQLTKFQETAVSGSHDPFTFTYYALASNGFGNLLYKSVRPLAGAGGGAQETTTLVYDALGNVTSATLPGNNAGNETLAYNYTTDGTYNTTESLGLPLTITDALGHTVHFRYDALADTTATIDPIGNETDYSFDLGQDLLTTTYPATGQTGTGRSATQNTYLYPDGPLTTEYLYSESGSVFRQVTNTYGLEGELLGVSGSTKNASTTYDSIYRPTTVADGLGHITKYLYNAQGYLDSELFPLYSGPTPVYNTTTGTWSNVSGADSVRISSYDAAGDPLTKVDGNGVTTTYYYTDPESLISGISAPGITHAGSSAVAYARDTFGNVSQGSDPGQGESSDSYFYDDYNSCYETQTSFSCWAFPGTSTVGTVEYFCNPDGSRSSVSSTTGIVSYTYDQGGRLLSLTNPFGEVYSYTYDNDSRILTQRSANSNIVTYVYNALGQRTDIKYTTIAGVLRCEFSNIVHNAAGQITSYTTNMPGTPAYNGLTSFTYDNAGQILTESFAGGTYTKSIVYDGANTLGPGNPTTINGSSHSFNADNQDTSTTVDGNGNVAPDVAGYTFLYDNFNHVYDAKYNSNDVQFDDTRIDSGLQWWRLDESSVVPWLFLYDGDAQTTYLELNGATVLYQTLGPNGYLNERAPNGSGGYYYDLYFAFDPQGNIALTLDTNGSQTASNIIDACGTSLISGKPGSCGMQWGEGYYNTGVTPYLLKARRYYNNNTGRFMSRDPIGYGGGINQYAFAGNDPVNNADPSGLDEIPMHPDGLDSNAGLDPVVVTGADETVDDSTFDVADGAFRKYVPILPPGMTMAEALEIADPLESLPQGFCEGALGNDESGGPSDIVAGSSPGGGVVFTKPNYEVDYNVDPDEADNIWHALKAGRPDTLTYAGVGYNSINRPQAVDGVPSVPGFQRDEYPFASTYEGGDGAWVGHIPGSGNARQGGKLSQLYAGMQAGDTFTVTVINHPLGP